MYDECKDRCFKKKITKILQILLPVSVVSVEEAAQCRAESSGFAFVHRALDLVTAGSVTISMFHPPCT